MAVIRVATLQTFTVLSSDTKPTADVPIGSRLVETDTGREFIYDGTNWKNLSSQVEGGAAHDAAVSGNPLLLGVKGLTGDPSGVANGDITNITGDEFGSIRTIIAGAHSAAADVFASPDNGDAWATSGSKYRLFVAASLHGFAPDSAHDRIRTVGNTAGSGLGALMVSPTGHAHNSVTADEQILGAAGKLHTITVHDITTGGVLTVYDSTAESGTVIATLTLVAGEGFVSLHYDVHCGTGLYMGYDGTLVGAFTVSYSV